MTTENRAAQWPETLQTFNDHFTAFFQRYGIAPDKAAEMAEAATIELSDVFGGMQFYIPRGDAVKRELRDAAIYKRSGIERAATLAAEYGLSQKQIWEISRKQRAKQRRPITQTG